MYNFADRLNGVSGSAIRAIFALLADPEIISFAGGNPSPDSFAVLELADIAKEIILNNGRSVLQYGNTLGIPSLKATLLNMVKEIGINANNENIMITSGSSQGIEMCAKAFLNPGDTVLTENPSFIGALQTFKTFQANLEGLNTDSEGIEIAVLKEKIAKHKPKFLYTIPTFQNPSGKSMSALRRKEVYDICANSKILILEDDPYRDINFAKHPAPLPIKALDSNADVIYLLSTSKTISPGLRVGACIAHSDIIAKFNICKQGEDVHTSNLSQAIVDKYLNSPVYKTNLNKTVEMYKSQCLLMVKNIEEKLPQVEFSVPKGGLFIWCAFKDKNIDATEIFELAVKNKVAFVPGTYFYCKEGTNLNTFRLNFSMSTDKQIVEGIDRLNALF